MKATQTKGNDSRRVFVNKKAKAILKTYLNANLSVIRSYYLFTTQKSKQFTANTLTQLLKRLYEQVGFKNCSGYSGRRTFITKLANSGVNVRVIAELASHKSIQTTQRYIDINDNLCSNAVELV
ncbi:tyrosine-type recombinase/integrase [bacterium]|nr:tyrosine-type recombinase/integrase [bacterium]